MLPDFIKALSQAYLAPQASARAILSTNAGFGGAVLLLALSYLLTNIVLLLTPGVDIPRDVSAADRHIFGVISTIFSFFVMSTLIYFFGKVSGGTGTREQTYVIVAWHSVVTAILSAPINLMMAGFEVEQNEGAATISRTPDTFVVALAVAAVIMWCWLLAHFITVLHGFRNFWGVAAVVMGIPVGLGFLMVNLAGVMSALAANGIGQ